MKAVYYALTPEGSQHELSIEHLTRLFTDWQSWVNFLRMTMGGSQAAIMIAHTEGGETRTYKVAKAPFESFG